MTAFLVLQMRKQKVLLIIPSKEHMLGPTLGPNSVSSLGFWLLVQFDQRLPLLTYTSWLPVAISPAFQAHSALTPPMPE